MHKATPSKKAANVATTPVRNAPVATSPVVRSLPPSGIHTNSGVGGSSSTGGIALRIKEQLQVGTNLSVPLHVSTARQVSMSGGVFQTSSVHQVSAELRILEQQQQKEMEAMRYSSGREVLPAVTLSLEEEDSPYGVSVVSPRAEDDLDHNNALPRSSKR